MAEQIDLTMSDPEGEVDEENPEDYDEEGGLGDESRYSQYNDESDPDWEEDGAAKQSGGPNGPPLDPALLAAVYAAQDDEAFRAAIEQENSPFPVLHDLFMHYNQLYFSSILGPVSVHWSSSRMTRCAGTCEFRKGGGCRIKLSGPLLQYRPVSDLKNTLLHEMIHALLFLTNDNMNREVSFFCCLYCCLLSTLSVLCFFWVWRGEDPAWWLKKMRSPLAAGNQLGQSVKELQCHLSGGLSAMKRSSRFPAAVAAARAAALILQGHGAPFLAKAAEISMSRCPDFQRPPEGYKITVFHTFHDEVEVHQKYHWKCRKCFKVIKRAMNRPPSEKDCRAYRTDPAQRRRCTNCPYHVHEFCCGGAFDMIAGQPSDPKMPFRGRGRGRKLGDGTKPTRKRKDSGGGTGKAQGSAGIEKFLRPMRGASGAAGTPPTGGGGNGGDGGSSGSSGGGGGDGVSLRDCMATAVLGRGAGPPASSGASDSDAALSPRECCARAAARRTETGGQPAAAATAGASVGVAASTGSGSGSGDDGLMTPVASPRSGGGAATGAAAPGRDSSGLAGEASWGGCGGSNGGGGGGGGGGSGTVACPICFAALENDDRVVNEHLDGCIGA
ncbi:unnamed protein product [Phaeothamnion confervicola]